LRSSSRKSCSRAVAACGNFGLAILIVTVLIKIVFFPLANKSYASMAKMKAVQPEMMAIRERQTL
jgi:YidC/Oxa1 family membrane protein insertase